LYQGWLDEQRRILDLCRAAPRASDDLKFALAQRKDTIPALLAARARILARSGKDAEALEAAEKLVTLDPHDGNNLYWAAGACALLCAAKTEKTHASSATDKNSLPQRYAERAMELLKQLQSLGCCKKVGVRILLQHDHNLDALRARDDFKKLLAEIAAVNEELDGLPIKNP
jgi:hypothetical protein